MAQPLDNLYRMSCNVFARVDGRIAANSRSQIGRPNESPWLAVLREELDLAEEEAEDSNLDLDTYRSGYDQGWCDAIRMIVDASQLLDQTHPRSCFGQANGLQEKQAGPRSLHKEAAFVSIFVENLFKAKRRR